MARTSSRSVGEDLAAGFRRWVADELAGLDPLSFLLASWWLALVAIAVLQQAHAGVHERHELAPLLHILRDGALAVPVAALAVATATVILGDRIRMSRPPVRRMGDVNSLAWALLGAAIFALLSIPGHQIHGAIFGAEAEELSGLADAALDAGIAFLGALLALGPLAVVAGPPVRDLQQAVRSAPHSAGPDRQGAIESELKDTH